VSLLVDSLPRVSLGMVCMNPAYVCILFAWITTCLDPLALDAPLCFMSSSQYTGIISRCMGIFPVSWQRTGTYLELCQGSKSVGGLQFVFRGIARAPT
jgi:hypothetical protein